MNRLAPSVPTLTAWFDSWGEGPFTVDDVTRYVRQAPNEATRFHTTDGQNFQEFLTRVGKAAEERKESRF